MRVRAAPQPDYMAPTADDFKRLYDTHHRGLLAYFQQRIGDAQAAFDLVDDTFTRAITNADSYRGSSDAELSGWLWAIAQSVLGDEHRRERRDRQRWRRLGRSRAALSDPEIERLEELTASAEFRELVALRHAELPEDLREAVRLRVVEEMSYREVAERLGIEPAAARARVSRGLRTLGLALESKHDEWRGSDS